MSALLLTLWIWYPLVSVDDLPFVDSLVSMDDGVKCETTAPAGGEVLHVDLLVAADRLTTPRQQRLLQVRLLKVGHDLLQNALHLPHT